MSGLAEPVVTIYPKISLHSKHLFNRAKFPLRPRCLALRARLLITCDQAFFFFLFSKNKRTGEARLIAGQIQQKYERTTKNFSKKEGKEKKSHSPATKFLHEQHPVGPKKFKIRPQIP